MCALVLVALGGCGDDEVTFNGRYVSGFAGTGEQQHGAPCTARKSAGAGVVISTGDGEKVAVTALGSPRWDWRDFTDAGRPVDGTLECALPFSARVPKSAVYVVEVDGGDPVNVPAEDVERSAKSPVDITTGLR